MSDLILIQQELEKEFADQKVVTALVQTTFKGLTPELAKQAALEGMMRGFKFRDFLERNVCAIPFRSRRQDGSYDLTYSLVTSIDHARKIGMRSGVIGDGKPEFEFDDRFNVVSCTMTIKRKVGGDVGEFSATVYFSEYTTGKNLWLTKPRTMLAKVAEMHALRKACPEELAQAYTEEELEKEVETKPELVDVEAYRAKLAAAKNMEELMAIWPNLPPQAKAALEEVKESLKKHFDDQAKASQETKPNDNESS